MSTRGLHHSIWLLNWAWEQEWCSGKSAYFPPLWLGLVLHVGWVCCWCWSSLQGFSLGSFSFPPFAKTNILNSNLTWKQWIGRATLWNVTKFPFICFFVIGFLTVIKYLRKVIYHENKLCWLVDLWRCSDHQPKCTWLNSSQQMSGEEFLLAFNLFVINWS